MKTVVILAIVATIGIMFVSLGTSEVFATDFKDSSGYNPEWSHEQTPERTFQLCDNVLTVDDFADKFDFAWCSEYVTLMKSKGMSMAEINKIPETTYKKYTDKKYGFSFEYPNTWYVEEVPVEEGFNEHYVKVGQVKVGLEILSIFIFPESSRQQLFNDMTGDDFKDTQSITKYVRVNCNYNYSMYEDGMDCRDFVAEYGEVLEVDGVRTIIVPYTQTIVHEDGYELRYFNQHVLFDRNDGIGIHVSQDTMNNKYEQRKLQDIEIDKFIRSFTFDKSAIGGGCLIATATYGTELVPQVQLLREIRDNSLLQTESGSAFMSGFNEFYYTFSPTIADWERESPMFKEAVKLAITPMITSLSLMENAESESEVLSIGIYVIALNLAMYLGVPAVVIIGIKKKF